MQVFDGECSSEYKKTIKDNGLTFQHVPPNNHHRNLAEKAIQTYNDHVVAVLCGTNDACPLQLWCQLLRHAEHQLNLLCKSRLIPAISAFVHMYGSHNFDAHPWAALRSAVELHGMPSKRRTWKLHTKMSFYLGAS